MPISSFQRGLPRVLQHLIHHELLLNGLSQRQLGHQIKVKKLRYITCKPQNVTNDAVPSAAIN